MWRTSPTIVLCGLFLSWIAFVSVARTIRHLVASEDSSLVALAADSPRQAEIRGEWLLQPSEEFLVASSRLIADLNPDQPESDALQFMREAKILVRFDGVEVFQRSTFVDDEEFETITARYSLHELREDPGSLVLRIAAFDDFDGDHMRWKLTRTGGVWQVTNGEMRVGALVFRQERHLQSHAPR